LNLKNNINRTLRRTVGYEVVRMRRTGPILGGSAADADPADRLLMAPVFILSSVRSGSTLLRLILDAHSQMHAPHELPLKDLKVNPLTTYLAKATTALGLQQRDIEDLLWDRLLHYQLLQSGKEILVSKTPNNVFVWRRIAGCWPDARFVFLLRHPAAIVASRLKERPHYTEDEAASSILRYAEALEEARAELPGATIRYEDLTADPEGETTKLCEFIGVDWEPEMLEYGREKDANFKKGLGDWSSRLHSGKIQEPEKMPDPDEIPRSLKKIAKTWGYL
jgi:Sulfotransferase family